MQQIRCLRSAWPRCEIRSNHQVVDRACALLLGLMVIVGAGETEWERKIPQILYSHEVVVLVGFSDCAGRD